MKQLNKALAVLAASLTLASPFVAQAQSDQQMDAQFNRQVYMKMANKDGMLTKADVMKVQHQLTLKVPWPMAQEIQRAARNASTALVPPKAKEFESMVRIARPSRAALGT